jgi:hypothetical protein
VMTANTSMQLGFFALHTTFFCSPHIGTYVVRYIYADRLVRTEPHVLLNVSLHTVKQSSQQLQFALRHLP